MTKTLTENDVKSLINHLERQEKMYGSQAQWVANWIEALHEQHAEHILNKISKLIIE